MPAEAVLCVDFGTSHTLAGVAYKNSKKSSERIILEPQSNDPYLMRTLLYFPSMDECYYGSEALHKYIENEMEGSNISDLLSLICQIKII
jgi:hypothetical chaperone protein